MGLSSTLGGTFGKEEIKRFSIMRHLVSLKSQNQFQEDKTAKACAVSVVRHAATSLADNLRPIAVLATLVSLSCFSVVVVGLCLFHF